MESEATIEYDIDYEKINKIVNEGYLIKKEEDYEINAGAFLMESMANMSEHYEKIDKIFDKDKAANYLSIRLIDPNYLRGIINNGDAMYELYYKKLILLKDKYPKELKVLIKKMYKQVNDYLISKRKLDMSDFFTYLAKKYGRDISTDTLNGFIYAAIYIAQDSNIKIVENETYEGVSNNLITRVRSIVSGLTTEEELRKDMIKRGISEEDLDFIYNNLKKKYMSSFELCPQSHARMMKKLSGLNSEEKEYESILMSYEFLYDMHINNIDIFTRSERLKDNEVKTLIMIYLASTEANSKEDINYEELYKYICPAVDIHILLKKHKRDKKVFLENFNPNLENEYNYIKELYEKCTMDMENLSEDYSALEKENDELRKKIDRLENLLNKKDSYKEELYSLREFMFEQSSSEETTKEDSSINLNKIKGIILGGSPNWISRMKEVINWTIIPSEAMNFDTKLLDKADYIFINTKFINHGMYYKVIENMKDNQKIRYLNNINIDRTINDIKSSIK